MTECESVEVQGTEVELNRHWLIRIDPDGDRVPDFPLGGTVELNVAIKLGPSDGRSEQHQSRNHTNNEH
jgi:hypothetical protein